VATQPGERPEGFKSHVARTIVFRARKNREGKTGLAAGRLFAEKGTPHWNRVGFVHAKLANAPPHWMDKKEAHGRLDSLAHLGRGMGTAGG